MAIASPVLDDEICMTNLAWRFSISALRQELGCQVLLVLNDFAALALALADLPDSVLRPIGPVRCPRPGAKGLLGAGTGLGVSGLIPGASHAVPLMGEGGHVTLAATNPLEYAVIEALRWHHPHVSAERVLSGAGLVSLHQALAQVQGLGNEADLTPAEVLSLGLNGESYLARQALDLFCGWLGSVAGDLALTLGAVGGVYVGGGIAPRMSDFLLKSSFRQRFTSKGRYRDYLDAIPTWLIDAPASPALDGAARALEHFSFDCATP
jgi:glucokinase